jgi:hypothetical protein
MQSSYVWEYSVFWYMMPCSQESTDIFDALTASFFRLRALLLDHKNGDSTFLEN